MLGEFMTVDNKAVARRIGKMIAKYRKNNDLTQAELAEKMHISNDAISRMERGGIMPSVPRLIQLAEILGCETADFLTNSSPLELDQVRRLIKLLNQIDEKERDRFLQLVENLVAWRLSKKTDTNHVNEQQ